MTNTPGLTPDEGAQAIFAMMSEIAEASTEGNLSRLDAILDQMESIVTRTGVEMPGLAQRVAAIKGQTARVKQHFENTDAALWVGDLDRARQLNMEGPALDMSALHGEAFEETPDFEFDADSGEEEDFNLSDFAADLGLSLSDLGSLEAEEEPEDLYADLANGVPGAIDALISTGVDLNAPSGPAQHTALLAALDAPGRSAETIGQLITAGADARVMHFQGDNAISWAMGYHHLETVTRESEHELIALLVANGADVNHLIPGQFTALQRALLQGGVPQVAALLAAGADQTIDMFEEFEPAKLASATLVMVAAAKPDVLRLLLDHGADAERPDRLGRRPLDFVRAEAEAARNRVDPDDGWTIEHAEALEISLGILERHLGA